MNSVEKELDAVELMEPVQIYQIYPDQFDISGIPRKFIKNKAISFLQKTLTKDRDGKYVVHPVVVYPADDRKLLSWCKRPLRLNGADRFHRPEIYGVRVKASSCTLEKCLELLKGIGREKRFIARSVESASVFFAELNKEDTDKLKGLDEICTVFSPDDRLYPIEDF
ncbi:hypothetical protein POM88_042978 [Heracleum sosnowskyi]|uniref:Uncharacterized protein n=1 Tax=Heracleum sosnowskyi TaxID=360622 RepID=A0AAD8HHG8_9APIA|nr:hypothetical protein POM88_042978 [Heracleum sosnowskyi]